MTSKFKVLKSAKHIAIMGFDPGTREEGTDMMHKQYTARMTIDSPGLAYFDTSIMTEAEISALIEDRSGAFRNKAFRKFPPKTVVKATFRVAEGSGRRYLLAVVAEKPDPSKATLGKAVETMTEKLKEYPGARPGVRKPFDPSRASAVKSDYFVVKDLEEDEVDEVDILFPPHNAQTKKPTISEINGYPFGLIPPEDFYFSERAFQIFGTAKQLLGNFPETAVRILVVGPSGYGKTSIAGLFADTNDMTCYRMNCASVRDPEEWFGTREAKDGSTLFLPSKFITTVTSGNAVIILDEYNRLEPDLHNTLYPLLDHSQSTFVHGEEFTVGPRTVFIATMNVGHQYSGTYHLDEANMNRFDLVYEVKPPDTQEEIAILVSRAKIDSSAATKIVEVAKKVRQSINVHCSIRTTLFVAKLVSIGQAVGPAFINTLLERIPEDLEVSTSGRKELIDIIRTCGLTV